MAVLQDAQGLLGDWGFECVSDKGLLPVLLVRHAVHSWAEDKGPPHAAVAFVCGTLALDAIAGSRVCIGPNARTRAHQIAGIALLAAAVRFAPVAA